MDKGDPVLIIGAGSIGERHIRNLWTLGYHNLHVLRERNFPFRNIADARVAVYRNFHDALQVQTAAAFICSPSAMHAEQAIQCLQHEMHVFAEKPLLQKEKDIDVLRNVLHEKNKLLRVGFMMRYHPFLVRIKDHVVKKSYGNLVYFHSHWGSYLPDWHPYEDYRTSYAARKDLGGGVAFTLCHDLDVANWMAGAFPENHYAVFALAPELEIDVESIADFILQYPAQLKAEVHLNYLDKPPKRTYRFVFEEADMLVDYFGNTLRTRQGERMHESALRNFERNDLYIDAVKDFFHTIATVESYTDLSMEALNASASILSLCTQHG